VDTRRDWRGESNSVGGGGRGGMERHIGRGEEWEREKRKGIKEKKREGKREEGCRAC